MECRTGCAACCISPSITQAIPNMPIGKKAGIPCANLDLSSYRCKIWEQENYPAFCRAFKAEKDFCGENREEALQILHVLENSTR